MGMEYCVGWQGVEYIDIFGGKGGDGVVYLCDFFVVYFVIFVCVGVQVSYCNVWMVDFEIMVQGCMGD